MNRLRRWGGARPPVRAAKDGLPVDVRRNSCCLDADLTKHPYGRDVHPAEVAVGAPDTVGVPELSQKASQPTRRSPMEARYPLAKDHVVKGDL